MNVLAIHLYLTIRYINLSFNYFGNFYRIIETKSNEKEIPQSRVLHADWHNLLDFVANCLIGLYREVERIIYFQFRIEALRLAQN